MDSVKNDNKFEIKEFETDVLIIGGGTAGCYAAIKLGEKDNKTVLIVEKANIKRSGCLAAGVNALNAYIAPGHQPEDYVEYARKDAKGIIRNDLMLSLAQKFNAVTKNLEDYGLVILKDVEGNYATRGWRNVKINGENIKPLLAEKVSQQDNVSILNHVNITDLKIKEVNGKKIVYGAWGFSIIDSVIITINAKTVIIATGGAAGLYKPNNPGFSRHKMWYSPFNTGAGYAMGIKAGAEMTTLEQRFVALRCKDTIAPTGTIAQGVGAKQVNSKGDIYENKYGLTTPERIYGTVEENKLGHGPCFLDTTHIDEQAEMDLYKAYLNMAPSQTLKWIESGKSPRQEGVEIEGTEPYIVGGHTGSGFWVNTKRETTILGLFAAGDVVGGAPQKYVTGALAEGEIAAQGALEYLKHLANEYDDKEDNKKRIITEYNQFFINSKNMITYEQVEEAMQKIMDEYAGGISTNYGFNKNRLLLGKDKISDLEKLVQTLHADTTYDLLKIYELKERLLVCKALIAHLLARKETRWHIFGENMDYPQKSDAGLKYVNSIYENGEFSIKYRELVKGDFYEHSN